MKKRTYLIGIFIIIFLLLSGWWLWKDKQVPRIKTPGTPAPTNSVNTATPNGPAGQTNASKANSVSMPPATATPVDPKVAQMRIIVAAENAKSLDLYGKVIDQYGNPIAGAKVRAGVGLIVSFTQSGGNDYYTVTNTGGKFSFIGIHGAGVGFICTKEGYAYNQRQSASSRPNDYVPDPNNPVVFHMWKLKGAEPLVVYTISTTIPCNGTPSAYNLLTGKKVTNGGDFIITLTRNPININRGQPFDWTATLQIPSGGLTEVTDLYPNEAPSDGYKQSVTIDMPADMKNWQAALTRSFYVRTGGQNYGRITLDIQADFQPPPTYLGVDVHLNPNPGDRNLEFDRSIAIKP